MKWPRLVRVVDKKHGSANGNVLCYKCAKDERQHLEPHEEYYSILALTDTCEICGRVYA